MLNGERGKEQECLKDTEPNSEASETAMMESQMSLTLFFIYAAFS